MVFIGSDRKVAELRAKLQRNRHNWYDNTLVTYSLPITNHRSHNVNPTTTGTRKSWFDSTLNECSSVSYHHQWHRAKRNAVVWSVASATRTSRTACFLTRRASVVECTTRHVCSSGFNRCPTPSARSIRCSASVCTVRNQSPSRPPRRQRLCKHYYTHRAIVRWVIQPEPPTRSHSTGR